MISRQSLLFEFSDGEYYYGFYFYDDDVFTDDQRLQISLTKVKMDNAENQLSYSGRYSQTGTLLSDKARDYCDKLLQLKAFW